MFRLKIVPTTPNFDFMRWRKALVGLSIAMVIASALLVAIKGLNFGIDFKGGVLVQVRTAQTPDIGALRDVVGNLGLGEVAVQDFGNTGHEVLIRVERQPGGGNEQIAAVEKVKAAVLSSFPGTEVRRTEIVGPKVSSELIYSGTLAVLLAVIGIMIYVWLRFEWQFAVAAVISLVHDVALTLGVFSLLGIDFTLAIIAAILTIIGYSLNDTVVVFDRVRENLRKFKTTPLIEVLNLTVNETLSRTTMTSLTTLIALVTLYLFGGEGMRGFSFAMLWGVLVGTYSSIYIAAPLLLWMGVKRDWSKEAAIKPAGVDFGARL